MKFLFDRYRLISIWLCLFVLVMAFVCMSDEGLEKIFTPWIYIAGMLLYGIGGVHEWMMNRRVFCLIELLLAICMLILTVLSFLHLGGIL